MVAGPNTHSFDALMKNWRDRLIAVERRLAKTAVGIPPRLSDVGQYTPDWDGVFAPGFYWSDGNTSNNPPGNGTWYYGGPLYHEGGNRATQFVYDVGGSYPIFAGHGWARYFDGTSWGVWRRLMSPHINENTSGSAFLDSAVGPGGPPSTYIAVNDPTGSQAEAMWLRSNNVTLMRVPKTTEPFVLEWVPWQSPSLSNDFTAGLTVAYARLHGEVHLRGELLRSTAPTSATVAFNLPVGFRPVARAQWMSWAAGITQPVGIRVDTNGNVSVATEFVRTATPGYNIHGSFIAA